MLVQFEYIYVSTSTHVKRCSASNTACTKLSKRKLERERVVQMRSLLSEGSVLDTFVYYSYSVLLPEYTRVYILSNLSNTSIVSVLHDVCVFDSMHEYIDPPPPRPAPSPPPPPWQILRQSA